MATNEKVEQASKLLERHRKDLEKLPGVVGTGIGLPSAHASANEIVVQVFVRSEADVSEVQKKTGALMGDSHVKVIVSGDMRLLDSESRVKE